MGNNLPNNVGTNIGISITKKESYLQEEKSETWYMSYCIGSSDVLSYLQTTYDRDGLLKHIYIYFSKPRFIGLVIRAENNRLQQINTDLFGTFCPGTNFVNETKNRWNGVTKTSVAYNWSEDEGSLVVVEQKRKSGFKMPCVVTVAYYYAINAQRRNYFILQKKYDVGLSITVDIRLVDNVLDLSWKGPSEHPSFALFEMFRQISRTWTWKWTACPHCAAQTHIQQFQTETENDDEESNYLQQPRQIVMGGNILANQGVIKGNNNGNFFVKQLNILRGG
ncbi:unnamed protein product [Trifolium pratense]|uniref:Uncharacterized protein n=1 Tax=Trifolium pratense TaxID=57577 RepID=A0ACB0IY41_TRIPR|nr:unnamed protein product [Trifolium pratense]